nr:VWA-like domain-containing protein [Solidesulfovibrio aerotolerans]
MVRKLVRARMELVLAHPFFGAMALRLIPIDDAGCRDMWTDGVHLGYNPLALASRSEEDITVMVAHEILHLACEHHLRRKDRDPALWNKACDLAIAALLVEAGFPLPKGHPFEAAQAGKPAEAIYAALTGNNDERGGGGSEKKAKTSAAPAETAPGGGDGDTPFAGAPTDPKAAPAGADLSGATRQRQSASGDKDGDGRIGDKSSHSVGEVRDHPDLDGARQEPKRRELTEKLRQDVSQSRRAAAAMGNMPAGLERVLAGLARPKLDWSTLLRRFILDRAVSDYSWSPPNRRHIHMGLYLPSPRSMSLGDVVLAIDTSGSVDAPLLAAFCAELSGVLEVCDARLLVYCCDMAVSQAQVWTRADPPLEFVPAGGGGTDYRPVFAKVASEGLHPACLLYCTDLECDRFPAEPPYPVLWVVPAAARGRPPFGDVLHLSA